MKSKSLTGINKLSNLDLNNIHLDYYSSNDARAALYLTTTTGSVGPFTNTKALFNQGYYMRTDKGIELMPYVTSGSIVNISNRSIVCFIFARMICYTGAGQDNEIDIEVQVNNATYPLTKLGTYQRTTSNTIGNNISGPLVLNPNDSLTLKVNKGYFNNLAGTQLSLIEFKNGRNNFSDFTVV